MIIFQLSKLKLYGEIRQEHANSLLKLVSESIGNIKEIILSIFNYLIFSPFYASDTYFV